MPGNILVSVLEFMNLPLSSSIWVSMGKREYQISDKGNFSFPLTSLRDDLIIKIQDSDGYEISHTGVQIKLIVEKGVWEDMFPLGEGHLHLKLQFILSDEERDRIRAMRQSALKKKQGELLSSSRGGAENDRSTITGTAALPFSTNDEVSESSKKHFQLEAVSRLKSPGRNVVEAEPDQKQLNPNIADQYEKTSSTRHPQRASDAKEMSIFLRSSEQNEAVTNNLIQRNQEQDGVQYSEKKSLPGRTPSNVRKMISAFESGRAQDMRSHIKPPPTKYQSSIIEKKDSSKTLHLDQDMEWNGEPAGILQERVKDVPLNTDYVGTGTDGSKYEKIQDNEKSKPKSSDDNVDQRGPVNQIIKVAIIVGFGILVLLTRQRKNRKPSRYSTSGDNPNS